MKIALLSDITLEGLSRKQLKNSENEFNFIFAEDLVSELNAFNRFDDFDILLIHFDVYFKKYNDNYFNLILGAVLDLTFKTTKQILCSNICFDGWSKVALTNRFGLENDFNPDDANLLNSLKQKQNFAFIDIMDLITDLGRFQSYKFELGHLYQMPYTKVFLDRFAVLIEDIISKFSEPDKKVIILDCDNTLWKGVVGEDGIEGISCDLNHEGILYFHFQQFLALRKSMGFILCLCSKNNEDDVRQAFIEKRMPLKWDDFLLTKINWKNKDDNLRDISRELSLGLDSFIFIDDSDFELMRIRDSLPEIRLFKINESYDSFIHLSKDLVFTKKVITVEDRVKTDLYLVENKRKNLERTSTSFEDYIKSLDIKMKIKIDEENDFLRVSQLTEKTNQFNFNKRFLSVEDLKIGVSRGSLKCFTLSVTDKFGDYGLVGVILVGISDVELILENYILSCRVLGRNIEYDFWDQVKKNIYETYGKKILKFKFNKTQKNIPAQYFYNQLKQLV